MTSKREKELIAENEMLRKKLDLLKSHGKIIFNTIEEQVIPLSIEYAIAWDVISGGSEDKVLVLYMDGFYIATSLQGLIDRCQLLDYVACFFEKDTTTLFEDFQKTNYMNTYVEVLPEPNDRNIWVFKREGEDTYNILNVEILDDYNIIYEGSDYVG